MIEPKLRFKADDESQFPDWEEKTLGDIGTAKMCKRVLKEQTSENGDVPFYKIGTFGGTPDAFISRELYEELKAKYSFPRKGNILLSAAGTIGRTVVYDGQDAFFQDSNIVWLDNDDSVLDGFLLQFYNKTSWDNLEGGTIKRLYNGLFLSKVIHLPSLPEQQKIAEFLSTIDTVIEKQKETVSAWEERKKGVMQKLFSQEVRFKADDGSDFPDWEEKKLGDISVRVLVGLATTVTPYYRKKGRPMFRNLNIKQGYLDDRDMLFLDEDYADSQKNKAIHFGDILTVHTGNIGWSCLVPEKYEGALSFTTLITTVKSNVVSNKYVCAFLNSPLGMNRMQNLAFSGGRANLNTSEFQKVQVPVPCLAEQQKIADCLLSLDEVIEKQKSTLAAWEELKKGLLQQMFV